jgi:serine/threonine-protein kinase
VTDRPVDPVLEAIIMRCLAKQPADRFADAKELRAALSAVPMSDWPDAEARAWWEKYRQTAQQLQTAPEVATMTIELDADRVASSHVKSA